MAYGPGHTARRISVRPTAGPLSQRVASWALVRTRSISANARSPSSISSSSGDKPPAVPLPGLLRLYSRKPYYTTGNERINAWPNRTDPIPADVLQMRRPNAGGISDTWGESAGRSADDEVVVQAPSLQGRHRGYDQAKNQMKKRPGRKWQQRNGSWARAFCA
jgi:hypothetical protein